MSARNLFDATIGRRLVLRIWAHGIVLFGGVIATVWIARWLMADQDMAATMREHPFIAARLAEHVLERADDRDALAREVAALEREIPLAITIYGSDRNVLASSILPPLAAANESATWTENRLGVVRRRPDGSVMASAVLRVPPARSFHWHFAALHLAALVLAFVFVAFPLARSIAKPIERLGALARELGAGNLAVRANSDRRDEIGELSRSFDLMAGQIRNLRAAERQLLGDVSHELRTPLARMRVILDLASDADLDRSRNYLREIASDLGELEQLVNDIIVSLRLDPETTRWDEARPPLRRTRVSIGELITTSVTRFRAQWQDRVIENRRSAADLVVDGDAAMLRRVLDNLLDNARKFSPESAPITIDVTRPSDRVVRIEVVDRGTGIAIEDQKRVFSPFFRADRSRTRASGGVGLGLALARRIVEAHGGSIDFASEPGQGSRFWFELTCSSASTADRAS